MDRAFIQLAGFTWGLTDSIFDLYNITPFHLNYVAGTGGSIGATGVWQWRYTAQLGGGLSASVAIEDPRRRDAPVITGLMICSSSGSGTGTSACGSNQHAGDSWPDVTANLKADGAWGSAQIAVAVRDASVIGLTSTTRVEKVGWAAMAGAFIKVPGLPGDTFGVNVAYGKGATSYVTQNINTLAAGSPVGPVGSFALGKGGKTATGVIADGVFSAGSYSLATAWSVEAGYEHAWSKTLKTSLAGGYVSIDYPSVFGLCGANLCDTTVWNVGSRTTWSPVEYLSLALDIMYTHVDSATGGAPYAGTTKGDVNVWTGLVRVQHAFYP
jgi:hypothetical protein